MRMGRRRIRFFFTLAFVVVGGFSGRAVAKVYFLYLAAVLRGDAPDLLGIMRMPNKLSVSDKNVLLAVFIVVGALLGFIVEFLAYHQFERGRRQWEEMAPQDKLVLFGGLLLGLVLTVLLRSILVVPAWASVAAAILLCYVSVVALESVKEQMHFYFPGSVQVSKTSAEHRSRPKLLDTNVIIDGRIADICRAGFLEGPIYIPKFVLEELQQIADSSDSLKRARGRRGLDILNQMQKEMELQVRDYSNIGNGEEVDARLVRVAHEISGAIVTNDFNLNRVAELQGVDVLNINELANAVKPVVLPGEEMTVTVIREGKEKDQGIGYLDDGTMIVVEGARRMIGETLEISVTSVLQTVQGKMIFGRIKENGDTEVGVEENVRSYAGGRPRRKIR